MNSRNEIIDNLIGKRFSIINKIFSCKDKNTFNELKKELSITNYMIETYINGYNNSTHIEESANNVKVFLKKDKTRSII